MTDIGSNVADMPPDAATVSRKSGSSFYAAMRILPPAQRAAMYEIYAFCRAVDDLADEPGPLDLRQLGMARWRSTLARIYAGETPHRDQAGLAAAIHSFGLLQADFVAVIDGMEMDLVEDIQAPPFAKLDLYCDRVASAVGRLAVRVFGVPEAEGPALAHHLGRAFQFTNILRDVDEDAAIQRLYLAQEDLAAAGIATTNPDVVVASSALGAACAPLVRRAQDHFAEGRRIMARCPRRSVKAPRIMADVYGSILDGVIARGFAPPRLRVKPPRRRILLALLKYGLV
jgi:squalene synthase HpnD